VRFRQTLPLGDRHLIGRLESFGDIVVGFSMSQLALQLEIPRTAAEVFAHSLRYVVFFTAFGVVSMFWFRFHRIMSTGFAPRRPDVVLLFAFLAFVALTPYALVTYSRMRGNDALAPQGVLLYLGVILGVIGFSWLLTLRGMRRAWGYLDVQQRRDTWRAFVAGAVAVPGFIIALVCIGVYGTQAFPVFLVVIPVVAVAGRALRQPWPLVIGPHAGMAPGTLAPAEVS
jgi:uncharacterized membrane protein